MRHEPAEIRNIASISHRELLAYLKYLPLDFVRDLDQNAHRNDTAKQLMRPINGGTDFRFVRGGSKQRPCAVFGELLAWDSAFFGYRIVRLDRVVALHASTPDEDILAALETLKRCLREEQVSYAFTVVDSRDLQSLRSLAAAGFVPIENRATYFCQLKNHTSAHRYPTRLASKDDVPSLAKTAVTMVNPYDRFHADPFIKTADADRMMYEWMVASIERGFADAVLVPEAKEAPEAFCTVKYHREHWDTWNYKLSQLVLSAVAPTYRGWHVKLVSEVAYHLKDMGVDCLYMTTQLANPAVIRTCEKLSWRLGKSELVLRLAL